MWRNQTLNISHNFLFGLHIQKQSFVVTCPASSSRKAEYLVRSTNNRTAWNSNKKLKMLHIHQVNIILNNRNYGYADAQTNLIFAPYKCKFHDGSKFILQKAGCAYATIKWGLQRSLTQLYTCPWLH